MLESVRQRLVNAAHVDPLDTQKRSLLPGIHQESVYTLPEGQVPATVGQTCIVVHPEELITINPKEQVRKRRLRFQVSVVTRIRDIPNDRFDRIYYDKAQLASLHESIVDLIESYDMFQLLLSINTTDKLSDQFMLNIDTPAGSRPVKYSVTRTFEHYTTLLNPIHLWPSYFHSKSTKTKGDTHPSTISHDHKIAGYRTYSSFLSPVFIANHIPLDCISKV